MTRGLAVVCTLLVIAVIAASAQGQSCQPGGQAICGPTCYQYNLLADSGFGEDGCWYIDYPAYRATSGFMCGWSAPFAKFPYTGQQVAISQTVQALGSGSGYGNNFRLRYEYEINDPNNNSANAIDVRIMQPNGFWYIVDQPPGGSQNCTTRNIDLGSHPEWVGQYLTVVIFGNVVNSNASITVDNVYFHQR